MRIDFVVGPWWVGLMLPIVVMSTRAPAQSPPIAASQSVSQSVSGARPGDVISLWIWREKDLTGEYPVDARGRVVLPMLGEVQATGRSTDSLVEDVRRQLSRYLTTPSMRITVLRRIAVYGQVARPGLYSVDATVTVADAIALAGGTTGGGDIRKARLMRDGQLIITLLGSETRVDRSPIQSGDELFVPQRSWVARNSGNILLALLSVVTGAATAITVTHFAR